MLPSLGVTQRSLPTSFKDLMDIGFDVVNNKSHWANEETMVSYLNTIVKPYVEEKRQKIGVESKVLLIYDAFRGHTTEKVQSIITDLNAVCIEVSLNIGSNPS